MNYALKLYLMARNERGMCQRCEAPLATTTLCRPCANKLTREHAARYWRTRTRKRIHSCYRCGAKGHMSKTCTRERMRS